jgi:hypothetical protein
VRSARGALVATAVAIIIGTIAPGTRPAGADSVSARPPDGSIGLRLLDVPADAEINPRARLYIVDNVVPGTVLHRRIQVTSTVTSQHVSLYVAAASIAGGAFAGAPSHTANEVSGWTSVMPPTIDVPGGHRVTAAVTITVPHDATGGERYAVVWAEARTVPARGGVVQISRVGLRIYLSVAGGRAPASDFTITALTAKNEADGSRVVLATVRNTGRRALDMSGTLELSAGPGALRAGPFPAALGTTLAIGDTEPVTIALDNRLPAGPWTATVTLRSGVVERTAQARLTFPAFGAARPVAIVPARRDWRFAVGGIAVILVVALVALASSGVRQHRRRAHGRVVGHSRTPASRDITETGANRELRDANEHIAQLERALRRKTLEVEAAEASRRQAATEPE